MPPVKKALNLPSKNFKVKIGPYTYDVEYNDKVAKAGGVYGQNHQMELTLYIRPNMLPALTQQTFLHEVIHAIIDVSGLYYRLKEDNSPKEEEITNLFTTFFHQFIQDNPEIFKLK